MPLTAQELVTLVMQLTGATTPTELAREIGMQGYSAPQRVKRWLDGTNEPDFEGTLLLLDAAGLLATETSPRERQQNGNREEELLEEIRAVDRKLDQLDIAGRLTSIEELLRERSLDRSP